VKSAYDLAAAAVPKSTVTTAGDVIYGTGSAAVTRLALGTAGQILKVNAGATAPEWATAAGAGGLTLIATATPSGATTISFTSIPTTYKHLMVVWRGIYQSALNTSWGLRFNSVTTGYYTNALSFGGTTGTTNPYLSVEDNVTRLGSDNSIGVIGPSTTSSTNKYNQNRGQATIYRYTELEPRAVIWNDYGGYFTNATVSGHRTASGLFDNSAAAITQVDFIRSGSQTITGTIYLYGVS
jgi:hypothetical protein